MPAFPDVAFHRIGLRPSDRAGELAVFSLRSPKSGYGAGMITFALALAGAAAAKPADPMIGTWMNRRETVAVQTLRCGAALCGRVVWAAPEAQQAAAEGGTPRLVGTMLMRNFRPAGSGLWQGEVFVPDLGQSAPADLTVVGPGQIEINGCLGGGLLCKRQLWHRARPPR